MRGSLQEYIFFVILAVVVEYRHQSLASLVILMYVHYFNLLLYDMPCVYARH